MGNEHKQRIVHNCAFPAKHAKFKKLREACVAGSGKGADMNLSSFSTITTQEYRRLPELAQMIQGTRVDLAIYPERCREKHSTLPSQLENKFQLV